MSNNVARLDAAMRAGGQRFRSRRERASELQERMFRFHAIYNTGWLLRNAYWGRELRQQTTARAFLDAVKEAALECPDDFALACAICDALMSSPHGVPWEA